MHIKNSILFITVIITVIAIAGTSGFLLQQFLASEKPTVPNSAFIGHPAQEFSMRDLEGNIRNITDWKGKVVLLNFWATWCPPCLREIPDFIELQNKYKNSDFQIIGIAIDNIDAVKTFATENAMNYPVIPAETEAIELGQRYGNTIGALPYSVFINRNGDVTHTIVGELDKITAEKILTSLNVKP